MNAIMKAAEPVAEPSALLAVLERVATTPNVNAEAIEKIYALAERAQDKASEQAFNEAMSRAQGAMGRISADAVNPQTRSAYATYGKLDSSLRPIYTHEGFALSFSTGDDAPESHVRVLCYVSHREGHTRTYRCDMPSDGKGAKGNDVMTKTHAAGSAMSYGQRYLLKLIFNVAIGEQDDDGNRAAGDYDPTAWLDAIEAAGDKTELDKLAAELREAKGIPGAAMRRIRQTWAARVKEVA